MPQYLDITGKKYGMLTAIQMHKKGKWSEYWKCVCDCGNEVVREKSTLQKGLSISCGCNKYKKISMSNTKPNKFEIVDNFVVGFTHKNEKFIFDVDDYDIVSQYTWHKLNNGYFCYKNKNQCILLHRLIMNPPDEIDIDHINHDKSDNRKSNLRFATRSQNLVNKSYQNKTGYRGVAELPSGKFMAQINGKYIGLYDTAQLAHEAYMSEAKQRYGEFIYEGAN